MKTVLEKSRDAEKDTSWKPTSAPYWVQIQAPAGNWVDSMGSNNLEKAHNFSDWQNKQGSVARVVERQERLVLK